MAVHGLHIDEQPILHEGTLLLAFTGWMDGGEVSTGTVERLIEQVQADPFARISPHGYYIDSFPGSMEVTALFRPFVKVNDGEIEALEMPGGQFFADPQHNLAFLMAREPNLNWQNFADAIYEVAHLIGIARIFFIGSFAGAVPHTREPRLHTTVSDPALKPLLSEYGVQFSNYEGPASFATYLSSRAPEEGIRMASLVAEIPPYIEGRNPLSIEAVTRRLAAILELQVDFQALRAESDEWESKVTEKVEDNDELAEQIREMEAAYDDDLVDRMDE
jgi:proteasome assembly chaperone (PAC2) family protein